MVADVKRQEVLQERQSLDLITVLLEIDEP